MSDNNSKASFFQRHNGKIALSSFFLVIAGIGYDVKFNEVELTDSNTQEPHIFQAEAIKPNSRDGYSSIYMEHGQTPYMFRAPDDQVGDLEVGDCFNATVTGMYVAALNGDFDKLRAAEISEVPCPE